jgi:hypothetical protein
MIIKQMLDAKVKAGAIKSDSEYQAEWNALTSRLTGSTIMTPREQGEQTNASAHNDTFGEVEIDLHAVYAQINEVGETITKHRRLNQSMLNNLKLRLKKVGNELSKYERLVNVQDAGTLHYETFIDANSFETDYTYYTERSGRQVPVDYHVKWDMEGETIKLPMVVSENGLIGAGGIRLGTVSIRKQLGSTMSELRNPLRDISKSIDTDSESFWSETISMDTPIRVDMGSEYYGVKFGALVEIEINFDYLTPMNEIGLNTFGEYPLDIIAIRYFETDDETEVGKELVYPGSEIPELRSRSVEGSSIFQFPDISAKRVRVILNQRHYIKKDLILSEKERRNLSLWISSRSEDGVREVKIDEYEIDHVIERFNEDRHEAVTKFEYQYGLYNLSVKRNEYQNAGVYVSKVIPISQNVKTMRLETKERHPEHASPLKLTDIEHYVHDGRNWYPVLPYSQHKVTAELLFPEFNQGQYEAKTRFVVSDTAIIRKNGVTVDKVILLADKQTVMFGEYDASAYYTIEYTPINGSWVIDFLEKYTVDGEVQPNQMTEEMRGTDSKGRIQLKQPPFVDKDKLNTQYDYNASYLSNYYVPIRVKLIDISGRHITQPTDAQSKGIMIHNVTDYDQTGQSDLKPYNTESAVYQYEVVGNEIQFNTVLPESTRILVEYPYLVSHVRVKAILRRNIPGFHGLTPVLEDYIAHFQTLV